MLAEFALAFNRASAYFIYDFGHLFEAQHKENNLNLNAKIFSQSSVTYSFDWNQTEVESEGGEGVFFQIGFPSELLGGTFEPSFLFLKAEWQEGDFEYFYGKPHLPKALGIGFSFNRGAHSIYSNYIVANGKILNNEGNIELFNSDFYLYNLLYKFKLNKNFKFYTGFAGINADASGALTAANQQYFLFPYSFYNVTGHINLKGFYGMINLKAYTDFAEYGIDLGAAVIAQESIEGKMHYKYRKFFGTEEVWETLYTTPIKGSGAVFAILEAKTKKIPLGKCFIQYEVLKPLALPFGKAFEKGLKSDFLGEADEGGGENGDEETSKGESSEDKITLKDIFLLGLTANFTIFF